MLQVASVEGNAPGPGALGRVERGHRHIKNQSTADRTLGLPWEIHSLNDGRLYENEVNEVIWLEECE